MHSHSLLTDFVQGQQVATGGAGATRGLSAGWLLRANSQQSTQSFVAGLAHGKADNGITRVHLDTGQASQGASITLPVQLGTKPARLPSAEDLVFTHGVQLEAALRSPCSSQHVAAARSGRMAEPKSHIYHTMPLVTTA